MTLQYDENTEEENQAAIEFTGEPLSLREQNLIDEIERLQRKLGSLDDSIRAEMTFCQEKVDWYRNKAKYWIERRNRMREFIDYAEFTAD